MRGCDSANSCRPTLDAPARASHRLHTRLIHRLLLLLFLLLLLLLRHSTPFYSIPVLRQSLPLSLLPPPRPCPLLPCPVLRYPSLLPPPNAFHGSPYAVSPSSNLSSFSSSSSSSFSSSLPSCPLSYSRAPLSDILSLRRFPDPIIRRRPVTAVALRVSRFAISSRYMAFAECLTFAELCFFGFDRSADFSAWSNVSFSTVDVCLRRRLRPLRESSGRKGKGRA